MRQGLWFGVVFCGLAVQGGLAQMNMGAQQQNMGANQSVAASIFDPVTGEPYKADKVTRSVQTLSDGTVITHETKGLIARDGQGRVREDLNLVHSGQVEGKQMDMTLESATVGDPVAHTVLIWTGEKTKMAMQMQMPSLPKGMAMPAGMMGGPPPPAGMGRKGAGEVNLGAGKDDVRTEDLGKQSLEGVLVTGTRMTTTIPLGKVGNDRPIVVVHEEWRSPELKILVKTVDKDPRTGEQTMELQGLVRTEPDGALFHAPAGYTVQDMAEMMKGFGGLGKTK